jgi:hypothetical protein
MALDAGYRRLEVLFVAELQSRLLRGLRLLGSGSFLSQRYRKQVDNHAP